MAIPLVVAMLASCQVLQLPERTLLSVSPISAGAWKVALAGSGQTGGCISVNPADTLAGVCNLFLSAATVIAVADLGRSPVYRTWLTAAISTSALLIMATGLLFPVGKEERVVLGVVDLKGPIEWWRSPLTLPVQSQGCGYIEKVCLSGQCYTGDLAIVGDAFGSYTCRNKFAGAICLTFPVAIAGLLFWSRNKIPPGVRALLAIVAFCTGLWLTGGAAASRAGLAAFVGGGLAFLGLAATSKPVRVVSTVLTVFYTAAIILFAVALVTQAAWLTDFFPEPLRSKLLALLTDGRAVAAGVAGRMFRASPVFGTGLGTFDELWTRMVPGNHTFYFAHNDLAQVLAETGLVGLTVIVGFGGWLVVSLRNFVRTPVSPWRVFKVGPWASVLAISIHSVFDWNLHVPANAFLACVVAGLAAASGRPAQQAWMPQRSVWLARTVAAAFSIGCATSMLLLGREARVSTVESEIRKAIVADRLVNKVEELPNPTGQMLAAADLGADALQWAPSHPRLHLALAQLYAHVASRRAEDDPRLAKTEEEYLEMSRLHASSAKRASPVKRGVPEPADQSPPTR